MRQKVITQADPCCHRADTHYHHKDSHHHQLLPATTSQTPTITKKMHTATTQAPPRLSAPTASQPVRTPALPLSGNFPLTTLII
ncbi:hypothetical protein DSO57_1025280 [Entomophthora muscae]|uniref:Uncharacterized protein n=1 Tax=Entomophthora muscae TaxID=34485 RepID=A0ACC2UBG7_9FUNG|nr:hypothetical protein DSO57_1025280 [Entomophthora muscae]